MVILCRVLWTLMHNITYKNIPKSVNKLVLSTVIRQNVLYITYIFLALRIPLENLYKRLLRVKMWCHVSVVLNVASLLLPKYVQCFIEDMSQLTWYKKDLTKATCIGNNIISIDIKQISVRAQNYPWLRRKSLQYKGSLVNNKLFNNTEPAYC